MRATTEQHDTPAAAIGFCDTSSPCIGVEHPSFPALFYMDIRADEPSGHTSFFNGYVTREVLALVKAAPDLLALARQYASECGECTGKGVIHVKQWPGGIEVDGERDCEDCADVRKVIAKATQVRS